jgi:hypothetical protein
MKTPSSTQVKVLLPTAVAGVLLSQEFPLADLETDGTLITVVIYGVSYSEAVTRIKAWMNRSRIGPVLVTDEQTNEVLLSDFTPRRLRSGLSGLRTG